MIIPSIDIMNGCAVQLRQGNEKVLERDDVMEIAGEFAKYGEIAVIDLDAALGCGENTELIKKICKIAACRVGGGIRTIERAEQLLQAGAGKIIIGTMATPDFLRQLPRQRVIVAVDTKDGKVMNKGWKNDTGKSPEQIISEVEPYCSEFLFTNINLEGMMEGIDLKAITRIRKATSNPLTVAGGISSVRDINALEKIGINSQIGMALYTGRVKLPNAFTEVLDFSKGSGLMPTIVQDNEGQVLMLAYSTKASLVKSLKTGLATYYSRSRKKLWVKGETSGCYQQLISARYDCDRDSLLFTVRQVDAACHTGKYSCYGEKAFTLQELYDTIVDRIKNPKEGSYTSKICSEERLIKDKIEEESGEVLSYKDDANLIWEIADLTYFILALMAKKGIKPEDVMNELSRRRK